MTRAHGRKGAIIKLFHKQRGKCFLCGRQMRLRYGEPDSATIEHVLPKARQPWLNSQMPRYNLVAACCECNNRKGDDTLFEYRMRLAKAERENAPPEPSNRQKVITAQHQRGKMALLMQRRLMSK